MVLHYFKMEDKGREPVETSVSMIFTIILFLMDIAYNFCPQIYMALHKVEDARNQFLLLM